MLIDSGLILAHKIVKNNQNESFNLSLYLSKAVPNKLKVKVKNNSHNSTIGKISTSLALFLLAGLFEIGGGYLVWLWLRENMSWILGAIGGIVLFLYGIVPTFQQSYFHRTYAAYGGIFIVMAILWGWIVGGNTPDLFDGIGAVIALAGVAIIFYMPRKGEKSIWSQ